MFKKEIITVSLIALAIILFIITRYTYLYHMYQQVRLLTRPTIVFIPGLGLKEKDYQYLINHLKADHYKVITYTSTDTTIKNYQDTVDKWTKGVGMLIGNRNVIVIGHSVGGSVATHFCATDKRCIAGINLDGSEIYNDKLQVPFLYVQADAGNYCDDQCFRGRALMEKVTSQSGEHFVHIAKIKHYNFTDIRTDAIKNKDYLGTIDGRNIIYANIYAFLKELP